MLYLVLSNLVFFTHVAFILFVVLGGLLVLRWWWMVWFHLPAAIWGILIEFTGWACPLTALEIEWLRKAGKAGYSGGFIEHYIIPLVYPAGLTDAGQMLLGFGVVAVNVLVYALVWRRRRRPGAMQGG